MMVWSKGKFYFSHKQSEQIIVTDNYIYECERSNIAEWMNCIDIFKYLFLYDCWSPFGRMLLFIAAILCKHTQTYIGTLALWVESDESTQLEVKSIEVKFFGKHRQWQFVNVAVDIWIWIKIEMWKWKHDATRTRQKQKTKNEIKERKQQKKNTNITSIFAPSLNKKAAAATVIIATATATDCILNRLPRGKRT